MKPKISNIGLMPSIGLGTWKLSEKTCEEAVKTALELGYRHIDTADIYDNHIAIGHAIKGFPREELFLVSKIAENNLRSENVQKACQRFLDELQTPYIDLLLIHWPIPEIPVEETLDAMLKLKEQQLIRNIGVSNFKMNDLKAIKKGNYPILTNQIEIHPYLQEQEITTFCQDNGIIVTGYSSIEKVRDGNDPIIKGIADKHHKTAVQVTLRWLFQLNIVSIPKASSKAHLFENINIFDFALDQKDMEAIHKLDTGQRFVSWGLK